jgi:hypothetical protein
MADQRGRRSQGDSGGGRGDLPVGNAQEDHVALARSHPAPERAVDLVAHLEQGVRQRAAKTACAYDGYLSARR